MAKEGFRSPTHEARRVGYEELLADSERLIPAGVEILKTLQGIPKRDFRAEISVAKSVNLLLNRYDGTMTTGVQSFEADGVFRGDFRRGKNWREYAQKGEAYVLYPEQQEPQTSYDGHQALVGGFVRGDKVGNGLILGNTWYLAVGLNVVYLIPVDGFKKVSVAPYYAGF